MIKLKKKTKDMIISMFASNESSTCRIVFPVWNENQHKMGQTMRHTEENNSDEHKLMIFILYSITGINNFECYFERIY